MNDKMGEMMLKRLALLSGFARNHTRRKDDLAKRFWLTRWQDRACGCRK